MVWHQVGFFIVTTSIIVGCASAPIDMDSEKEVNRAVDVDYTVNDGSVASKDYLDNADPDSVRKCRRGASTGSRVSRPVCGPEKDNSGLLTVIGSPAGPPESDSN